MAQAMTERCYRTKGLPQGFRRVHKDADAPLCGGTSNYITHYILRRIV